MENEIMVLQEFYTTMRNQTRQMGLVTFLSIRADKTWLVQGELQNEYKVGVAFGVGSLSVADGCFKHNPPTPPETEMAIMVVEDEIMPFHRKLLPGAVLVTSDAGVLEIIRLAYPNSPSVTKLTRTDVEVLFGRLNAIISGRPASMDVLPTENEFAARLLIVREVLHHLGFVEIHFVA